MRPPVETDKAAIFLRVSCSPTCMQGWSTQACMAASIDANWRQWAASGAPCRSGRPGCGACPPVGRGFVRDKRNTSVPVPTVSVRAASVWRMPSWASGRWLMGPHFCGDRQAGRQAGRWGWREWEGASAVRACVGTRFASNVFKVLLPANSLPPKAAPSAGSCQAASHQDTGHSRARE